jgi:hypothetical protein
MGGFLWYNIRNGDARDNLASAALYSGTNNIFTVTPNEVPTLELDYVTYDKYNQNKVYIYNEATGVWQIIVQ